MMITTGSACATAAGDELAQWGHDAKSLVTAPLNWETTDWFWFEAGVALTAASFLLDRRLYRQWNGASGAAGIGNAWALAAPAGVVAFYGMQGLFGFESWGGLGDAGASWRAHIEFSRTTANLFSGDFHRLNEAYTHGVLRSGYRYYGPRSDTLLMVTGELFHWGRA